MGWWWYLYDWWIMDVGCNGWFVGDWLCDVCEFGWVVFVCVIWIWFCVYCGVYVGCFFVWVVESCWLLCIWYVWCDVGNCWCYCVIDVIDGVIGWFWFDCVVDCWWNFYLVVVWFVGCVCCVDWWCWFDDLVYFVCCCMDLWLLFWFDGGWFVCVVGGDEFVDVLLLFLGGYVDEFVVMLEGVVIVGGVLFDVFVGDGCVVGVL